MEAIMAGAGFVARSFSGDAKQVRELLKAALSHRGTAVLDIISPCVAFNNVDTSSKSYGFGREHEAPLHDFGWVPPALEIEIEEHEPGTLRDIIMHDGSHIQLRKLQEDYDPTNRMEALRLLEETEHSEEFVTGLIYFNPVRESLAEAANLPDTPLALLPDEVIRPSKESLADVMASLQ
jgi:2-oxoglutarate ferredoxin oxidoreductase subunit beta